MSCLSAIACRPVRPRLEDIADVLPFDVAVLGHLQTLLVLGAIVIVTNAGRRNLWNELGLRSPFAQRVQWDKHQEPAMWISIFGQAGFQLLDLRWFPLSPFGRLTAHRFAQFTTVSHFVLRFPVPNVS